MDANLKNVAAKKAEIKNKVIFVTRGDICWEIEFSNKQYNLPQN
jgi:hypothetical protein